MRNSNSITTYSQIQETETLKYGGVKSIPHAGVCVSAFPNALATPLLLFTSLLTGAHCAKDDESHPAALLSFLQPRAEVIRGLLRQTLSCDVRNDLCYNLEPLGNTCCLGLHMFSWVIYHPAGPPEYVHNALVPVTRCDPYSIQYCTGTGCCPNGKICSGSSSLCAEADAHPDPGSDGNDCSCTLI